MNATTQKELNEVKSERVYVVSFDNQTLKRHSGYGNIGYVTAVKYVMEQSRRGLVSIIISENNYNKISKFEINTRCDRIGLHELLGLME